MINQKKQMLKQILEDYLKNYLTFNRSEAYSVLMGFAKLNDVMVKRYLNIILGDVHRTSRQNIKIQLEDALKKISWEEVEPIDEKGIKVMTKKYDLTKNSRTINIAKALVGQKKKAGYSAELKIIDDGKTAIVKYWKDEIK